MYLLRRAEMMIDLRTGTDRDQLILVSGIEGIPAFFDLECEQFCLVSGELQTFSENRSAGTPIPFRFFFFGK
jgi:hypothetical protein